MAARPKELRVLSGLHEGARAPAGDGSTIGSDPARDIVLADAGVAANAATLKLDDDGWRLESAGGGAARSWRYNEPAQAGPVWVSVADEDAPWPAVPGAAAAAATAALAGTAAAPAVPKAPEDKRETPAAAVLPGPRPTAQRPPWRDERPQRGHGLLLVLGLAAVVIAILAAIGVAGFSGEPMAERPSETQTAAEASIGPISEAIDKLGLAGRVHVTLNGRNSAVVSGWVHDGAERDQLYAAMARISPMPAMRVSNEAEIVASAQAVLGGFGVRYRADYLGEGRLAVSGVASDADSAADALAAVRAQAPGLAVQDGGILMAPEVADTLLRQVREAGLPAPSLNWSRNSLEVFAPALDDDQAQQLAALVEGFNAEHFAVARMVSQPAATDVADSVPFAIRSVVSGAQPYVVMADGSKLMPGGTYQRYRLVAIERDRLVFEGPRRAVVAR